MKPHSIFSINSGPCNEKEILFEVMSPKLALMANYTFYQTFMCRRQSKNAVLKFTARNKIFETEFLFLFFILRVPFLRQQIPVAQVF